MYKQTANYDCPKKTAQNNILFTGFAFLLKAYDRAYLHILILKYQYFNYFTVKGKRKRGRQKKRWEDNIKEWTGMDFASSTRAAEKQVKMERGCCEFICGAPTTFQGYGIE